MFKNRYWTNLILLLQETTLFETVFTAVVSSALGILFWGWTFFYDIFKPFLKVFGLNYSLAGLWVISAILVPQIIRRPGLAIASALISAFIESLFSHWGLISLTSGIAQGIGAELIFLLFQYRKWNMTVLILATCSSALCSYSMDYFIYDYSVMPIRLVIVQITSFIISSLIFSTYFSSYIINRLKKLGLLNRFLIVKNNHV